MIRLDGCRVMILQRIPRESGDDPDGTSGQFHDLLYSPRERG